MLLSHLDEIELRRSVRPLSEGHFFPSASNRAVWTGTKARLEREGYWGPLHKAATEAAAQPIPALPLHLRLQYSTEGLRKPFERPYFLRRSTLGLLTLVECLENDGRWMVPIADLLWALTEETDWCLPAHNHYRPGDPLPDPTRPHADLFTCETAAETALVLHLLSSRLTAFSPILVERIRSEIERRCLRSVEELKDHAFLTMTNNWAPWCASNVLAAANLQIADAPRWARLAAKLCRVVDRYFEANPADGGCDEGPGYWARAAGSLLDFLCALEERTSLDLGAVWQNPQLQAMGRYLPAMRLSGPHYASFSDSMPQTGLRLGCLYRYGVRTRQPGLSALATWTASQWQPEGSPIVNPGLTSGGAYLSESLRWLFWVEAGRIRPANATEAPVQPLSFWLPDTQIWVARSQTQDPAEWVLAAKGGHNAESHNHNDLGHFILFSKGCPLFIDLGRGNYTAQTFGPKRYELYFTRTLSHNAPLFDGCEQAAGHQHLCLPGGPPRLDNNEEVLDFNLTKAYPAQVKLQFFRRQFGFPRPAGAAQGAAGVVRIEDSFGAVAGQRLRYSVCFITPAQPLGESGEGRTSLLLESGGSRWQLSWEGMPLQSRWEKWAIEDETIGHSWGPHLYRLFFEAPPDVGGRIRWSISAVPG